MNAQLIEDFENALSNVFEGKVVDAKKTAKIISSMILKTRKEAQKAEKCINNKIATSFCVSQNETNNLKNTK